MLDEARVEVSVDGGAVNITGAGTLTFINGTEFGEKLQELTPAAESVTVDLRQADFIDTQILQDLGRAGVNLLSREKRLRVLVTDGSYTLRVLKLSGYETIMDLVVEQTNG